MTEQAPGWACAARSRWRFNGAERPAIARAPRQGEQSVWDFPRPPAVEPVRAEVCIRAGDFELARSRRCLRVLETGSPPTYYIPADDLQRGLLRPSALRSQCEWKGEAAYWDLELGGERRLHVAWTYAEPFPEFERLRDHFAFYARSVDCFVGSLRARPQPGDFYGGWITPELVGPFKGEPGTQSL